MDVCKRPANRRSRPAVLPAPSPVLGSSAALRRARFEVLRQIGLALGFADWRMIRPAQMAIDRTMLMDKAATQDFVVEVVHKMQDQQGFIPLPRRWVVERTLGWMMHWRRLVRDYERRIDVSESMIYVAMSDLLLKRLFE